MTIITLGKDGKPLHHEDVTPSEYKEHLNRKMKLSRAADALCRIFGQDSVFFVGISTAENDHKDMFFISNTRCVACHIEAIVESAQTLNIKHLENGLEIFELPKNQVKM